MATVTYTVINGVVLSENRGGTLSDYVANPLGSTVALLNNIQQQTDTFEYWPYGEVKTRTGVTATPFQYVGTEGYYQDSSSQTYVRARYLQTVKGRWLTEDPIGFEGEGIDLYAYSDNAEYSTESDGEDIDFYAYYNSGENPIGFEGEGINLYAYSGNSPVTFLDPDGLQGGLGIGNRKLLKYLRKTQQKARRLNNKLIKIKYHIKGQKAKIFRQRYMTGG